MFVIIVVEVEDLERLNQVVEVLLADMMGTLCFDHNLDDQDQDTDQDLVVYWQAIQIPDEEVFDGQDQVEVCTDRSH